MHCLAGSANVLVGVGQARRHIDLVAADQGTNRRVAAGGQGPVIGLADKGRRYGQGFLRNGCRAGTRRRCQHIVAGIGARQIDAGNVDRNACSNILASKRSVGRDGQNIIGDPVVTRGVYRRNRRTVILLVRRTSERDVQGAGRDVGAGGPGSGHAVVAPIGATQRNGADVDQLAVADVFIGKGCGTRNRQRVAGNPVVAGGNRGCSAGVVDAADAVVAHIQRSRRNVRSGTASTCCAVISGIGARQVDCAHRNRAGTNILAGCENGRAVDHHTVIAEGARRGRHRRCIGAVVNLVDAGVAHAQRGGCNDAIAA